MQAPAGSTIQMLAPEGALMSMHAACLVAASASGQQESSVQDRPHAHGEKELGNDTIDATGPVACQTCQLLDHGYVLSGTLLGDRMNATPRRISTSLETGQSARAACTLV